MNPPSAGPAAADSGSPQHVPGSDAAFTIAQLRDLYSVPDWHPDEHPPMPGIVAHGRKPGVFACGYCHYANGLGRPENTSLAGQPAAYIEQQLADYRDGTRGTAFKARVPAAMMLRSSKAVTDAEAREAALYFASLPMQHKIRVVETDTVPKTKVVGWALVPSGEGMEPLGERIIEIPEDAQHFALRDPMVGVVAYVPPGSIDKGRALVDGGPGRVPCTTCHGRDMRGVGPIPGIAGRSPSYVVRQLYEFQHGIRAGAWSGLMAPQVGKLTLADIVAIAAYTSSLDP